VVVVAAVLALLALMETLEITIVPETVASASQRRCFL
jgi:hypothetical protein